MFDHVVRRGIEHPATINFIKRAVKEGPELQIPKWGVALLVVTCIAFFLFMILLEYSLRDVVATLAMVETPSAAITVSQSDEIAPKDVKEALLETGPSITLIHQKPITSSIRGTLRHLTSEAGRFSRWRGILSFIAYTFVFNIVVNIFHAIIPDVPGKMVLVAGISGGLLANVHAAWTHKVIAAPAEKRFQLWRRIPARSNWRYLAPAAAVNAASSFIALYVGAGWSVLLRLDNVERENLAAYTGTQWASLALRFLSLVAVMFAIAMFIILPARVTQIRVEASILPEDQDTIVPFDRTFAGKVVPKILGGTGAVGFLDAWRSFNWEARRRLIKIYVKICAIVTVSFIALAHILAFEAWIIMGPAVMAKAKHDGYIS
jgi:hypothetical protein